MNKKIILTIEELNLMVDTIDSSKFSFDTEGSYGWQREYMIETGTINKEHYDEKGALKYTTLAITGISLCDNNNAYYIPIAPDYFEQTKTSYLTESIVIEAIKKVFSKTGVLIAHNIVYDAKVLLKYGIDVSHREFYCTMVAEHLINENNSKSLKRMKEQYFGGVTTNYKEVGDNHYCQDFFEYGLNDAIYTYQIYIVQKEILIEKDLVKLFRGIEMPFQKVLVEMNTQGVLIDKQKLELQKVISSKDRDLLYKELHIMSGKKYGIQTRLFDEPLIVGENFNSPEVLREVLFENLGLSVIEKTPTGNSSVGKFTLLKYSTNPFVSKLLEYKACEKIRSSFLLPMDRFIESDGRIRCNFRDTGTRTGRLSCSDPNLQQLADPKKVFYKKVNVRDLFLPTNGKSMITIDYTAQEVRVAAQVTKEKSLIDSITKGKDIHLTTANDSYNLGIPEEVLYDSHPEHEDYKIKFEKERNDAKVINFGILYGKGSYGFSKDFDISDDEAQKILDIYFLKNPLVKETYEQCRREVISKGYVRTFTGRYRHFEKGEEGFYPKKVFRQAFNFLIQGASSDITRLGCINVYKYYKDRPEYGVKCLMTVHDELVIECNKEYEEVVRSKCEELFSQSVTKSFVVPLSAHAKIGSSYDSAK